MGRTVFYKYFVPTGLTEVEAKDTTAWAASVSESLDQSFLQFCVTFIAVQITD